MLEIMAWLAGMILIVLIDAFKDSLPRTDTGKGANLP